MIRSVQARLGANRGRLGFALLAAVASTLPFAEGVLKNGWIEVVLLALVGLFLLMPGAAHRLQNLLLSLVVLCVTVPALDLALRPMITHRLHYTPSNIFSRKLPTLPIVGRWDPNVSYIGEGFGDLAAISGDPKLREVRQIEFRTDSTGFRNNGVINPVDLVVLGDSFGAGVGTTQERTFPRLLVTQYGRKVYNLSFQAVGPWGEYVNFATESPRLNLAPNAMVVWALYTGNDLEDDYGPIWEVGALPWRKGFSEWLVKYRTFRGRSPIRQLTEGLKILLTGNPGGVIRRTLPDGRSLLFLSDQELRANMSLAEVVRHPNYTKLERTLGKMQSAAGNRKVNLTVVIFPTKGEVYRWILEERKPNPEDEAASGFVLAVMAGCERVHLRCLDAKPFLVREARRLFDSSEELLWWRDDTHWGERGHEVVAAMIAREVLGGENKVTVRRDVGNSRL